MGTPKKEGHGIRVLVTWNGLWGDKQEPKDNNFINY